MVKKIYPTDIKKYEYCHIKKETNGSFTLDIRKNKRIKKGFYQSGFSTYEKALKLLQQIRKEYRVKIKNMIYKYDDHCECKLTKGHRMIFDFDDIDKVQKHTICSKTTKDALTSYAYICKLNNFANIIMNHVPEKGGLTVDHISRNGLDNRKCNLRIISKRLQNLNRNLAKNSKSGILGVCRINRVKSPCWTAKWSIGNNEYATKSFACSKYTEKVAKKMAIKHYNLETSKISDYNTI